MCVCVCVHVCFNFFVDQAAFNKSDDDDDDDDDDAYIVHIINIKINSLLSPNVIDRIQIHETSMCNQQQINRKINSSYSGPD